MIESDHETQKSLYQRFQNFVARNRENNQKYKTGWHEKLQNIYVSHYQVKNPGIGKTQLCHKYPAKK